MTFFRKGIVVCKIDRSRTESDQMFYDRCTFIVNLDPKTESEYNQAVLYSNIYVNHKYLKCLYNSEIMNQLNKMTIK